MTTKYFADVFNFTCPNCQRNVVGVHYYKAAVAAAVGAVKQAGVVSYTCYRCAHSYPTNKLTMQAEELNEVPWEEARQGVLYDCGEQA